MAKLIVLNVSAVKTSAMFMLVCEGENIHVIKSWGKASYPVPSAIVMDKDVNASELLTSCGLEIFNFKSGLDYANNCFQDDSEKVKLHSLIHGKASKPATVAVVKPVAQAVQPAIVSIEHDAQGVPSMLADSLSDYDKKAVNFKQFRAVCLAEGMPEKLTSPNAVTHWARNQVTSQPTTTATVATQAPSEAVAAPQVDMAMFMAFQAFMQSQGK